MQAVYFAEFFAKCTACFFALDKPSHHSHKLFLFHKPQQCASAPCFQQVVKISVIIIENMI
jgi:hypothetical protein